MEKKKIMILGGNVAQVPLIAAAQREKYFVVLIDYTTTNPGIKMADKHYQVNFMDKDKVLEIAKKEQIKGIISNSEFAMPVVAYVAETLNLVGNTVNSVSKLGIKYQFRMLQHELGMYAPRCIICNSFENALENIANLSFPVIIKPAQSSGSRGAYKVESYDEFKISCNRWNACRDFSLDKKVLMEEFIEMPNLKRVIDGDVFIYKNSIFMNGLFSSCRNPKCPTVPSTQIYPIVLKQEYLDEVKNVLVQLFAMAGIVHGEYNIEMYYSNDNQLFCIEINVRQGGNGIPEMIYEHCGVDMYKLLVSTTMGDDMYFDNMINGNNMCKYVLRHGVFGSVRGVYKRVEISPQIYPYMKRIKEVVNKGEVVNPCKEAGDVIAYVDFEFDNREQQLFFADNIENYVSPVIEKTVFIADRTFEIQSLLEFLSDNDKEFTEPLSVSVKEKIGMTLEQYVCKLCKYGTIVYELDGNIIKGVVIGYTHELPENGYSYITQVVTSRKYRGKGVSSSLLQHYIDYCRESGIKGVWLTTDEKNRDAQHVYERVGFVKNEIDEKGRIKYIYDI